MNLVERYQSDWTKKVHDVQAHGGSEPLHAINRDVSFRSLYRSDIGSMKLCEVREFLLRQTALDPVRPHLLRKPEPRRDLDLSTALHEQEGSR